MKHSIMRFLGIVTCEYSHPLTVYCEVVIVYRQDKQQIAFCQERLYILRDAPVLSRERLHFRGGKDEYNHKFLLIDVLNIVYRKGGGKARCLSD